MTDGDDVRIHTDGGNRLCADHGRSIRHPPHEWKYRRLKGGALVVHYDCPGSTLGKYGSREEWMADQERAREAVGSRKRATGDPVVVEPGEPAQGAQTGRSEARP